MTSPDAFFIFSKFWFSSLLLGGGGEGGKWQKMAQVTQKMCHSKPQELYLIWLWFLVHMCKRMISPAIFFHFFKILIFQVFQSSSINAKRKFWGVPHLLHMCVIFFFLGIISRKGASYILIGRKEGCFLVKGASFLSNGGISFDGRVLQKILK